MIDFEFYTTGLTKYYMIFYSLTNKKILVKLGSSPNFFFYHTQFFSYIWEYFVVHKIYHNGLQIIFKNRQSDYTKCGFF